MLTQGIRETTVFVGPNQRDAADVFFASFEFTDEITGVHPYIHARTTACRYRTKPPYARFYWNGKECVLYETSALVGIFDNREEAETFGPGLLQLINETYDARERILPADPNREPLRAIDVLRILPRTNCAACGFETCLAFAVAVARGDENPWACPAFPQPRESRAHYLIEGMDRALVIDVGERHTAPPSPPPEPPAEEPAPPPVGNIAALSQRELQVLELMALGFSNREIGAHLGISPHTVKTHTAHIFEKLDCTDRTQASVWASRAGLV